MKSKLFNLILILFLLCGVGLLVYPTVSDMWNKAHQTQVVVRYTKTVDEIDTTEEKNIIKKARRFNKKLDQAADKAAFIKEHRKQYENLLNWDGSGVMGYVDIPQIHTTLPIYHGTAEEILQVAIGHVEWTSLPVGGKNTHTVLSGHRGLPSAELLTNLDAVQNGDVFSVHIAHQVFYYEVDQILVVKPEETDSLLPVQGKDYCTLVTCTPYGINTHRLLVRGHRTQKPEAEMGEVISDLEIVPSYILAIAGLVIVWILFGFIKILTLKRNRR